MPPKGRPPHGGTAHRTPAAGRLHLVVGDSIARRARFAPSSSEDRILDRAKGGATWETLLERLGRDIAVWQTAATAQGLATGNIIVWMTGNDVYSRATRLAHFDLQSLQQIGCTARRVVSQLAVHAEVIIFGPLPRLAGEVQGATWEQTAAYHLERTLIKEGLCELGSIVPLGRALTRKMGRKRHGLKGCEDWFRPDGVHLSAKGYAKLAGASSFPEWLKMGAASQ